jgi:SAM-dependent methyltransferase
VDLADVPTIAGPRLKILPNTAFERLPFADGIFDAAISQFAFEYGDVELAAGEVARVLTTNGRISFLVHHAMSAIVASERIHFQALSDLTSEAARSAFLAGDRVRSQKLWTRLERGNASNSAVKLAVQLMRSAIIAEPRQRRVVWTSIVEAVAPDLALAGALLSSCVDPGLISVWLKPLGRYFALDDPVELLAAGEPIAWRIAGARRDDD